MKTEGSWPVEPREPVLARIKGLAAISWNREEKYVRELMILALLSSRASALDLQTDNAYLRL